MRKALADLAVWLLAGFVIGDIGGRNLASAIGGAILLGILGVALFLG